VILEGPNDILIEQSLRFEFKASNNQAEYEALIAGMTLAKEMGAENLRAKSDSQLITSQITAEYQTKDIQLIKYLAKVQDLAKRFTFFEAVYVPREQNSRAALLAKLASTKRPGNNRTFIQEVIAAPNTRIEAVHHAAEGKEGWMEPLLRYLTGAFTPANSEEDQIVRKRASKFVIISGNLYK
jgi:ribonuclease HI